MVSFTVFPTGTEIAQELAHDVDELGYFLCRLNEENADALGKEIAETIPGGEAGMIVAWLRDFADAIEDAKEGGDL